MLQGLGQHKRLIFIMMMICETAISSTTRLHLSFNPITFLAIGRTSAATADRFDMKPAEESA
jgi:hypothetical protein